MRLSKETQVRIYQFSPLESTGEFISFVLLFWSIFFSRFTPLLFDWSQSDFLTIYKRH